MPLDTTKHPPLPSGDETDRLANDLLATATAMLHAIGAAGIVLNTPINIFALQLLGPVIARAIGDDPTRNQENLVAIAKLIDVSEVRKLIQGEQP